MLYFGPLVPTSVESLLAVALDNIEDLKREVQRNRDTIHRLQSTLRGVELLTEKVRELRDQLPNLARQAARDAVTEYKRREHSDHLANWRTYTAVLAVGISLGGFIVSLVHG
jgi:hypothetical protein